MVTMTFFFGNLGHDEAHEGCIMYPRMYKQECFLFGYDFSRAGMSVSAEVWMLMLYETLALVVPFCLD